MSDQIKIKRTTIERGVRIAHGSGGGSGSELDSSTLSTSIAAIKTKRDAEKQVLGQLNDRFAKYIERVKFLEGQNKKLLAELDEFRDKWGLDSRVIRERYEPELLEARATIDDTTREKAAAEIRAKRAEYDALNFKRLHDDAIATVQADKNKIANLQYLLQENAVELDLLRRQKDDTENDIEKYKSEIRRLDEDLRSLLTDLDQETLRRVKLENEKQTLEEQIPFLNAIHEQEMAELRLLQSGAQLDPTQFYKHELERAIRDIRSDFEELNEQQKRELEEWYKVKTEEIVQQANRRDALDSIVKVESSSTLKSTLSESSREYNELRQANAELVARLGHLEEELDKARHHNGFELDAREREIAEVRLRLHELMADYDELMNSKTSLEFEINTYRRLLESEETRTSKTQRTAQQSDVNFRFSQQIKSSAESSSSHHHQQQQQQQQGASQVPVSAEMSSKTTFQRSAKGPVSISECSPDGKVIILENTSRNKDIDLTQWVLKRRVDSNAQIEYKFPDGLVLKANKTVRLWARGNGKEQPPSDVVNQELESWGVGVNVVTILLNDQQEEKATHLQKTVYSS